MSPQNKLLIVGLASPGLLWLATSVAFGQVPSAPQGPPTSAPASPETYRVLLLSNGKVIRGEIIDVPVAKAYCLKGSGGPVPYPKSLVLKAAQSVEELYQFQVGRLPEGDPDERIKLAKWCLTERMVPQAKEQLDAVGKMCPNDAEVKRMLYNLAASHTDRPQVDPELRRTSVEVPGAMDPAVLKNRRKFNGLPQIFNLPPVQAVKRANEFAQYVQPVLQQSCVKCHNEKYQGDFQLVEVKSRRDQTNTDILRANLDATLRLINQDDPSRSELLSAGLVPHPRGSRGAIFKGPNDQGYMTLVTWIKRIFPPANPADAQKAANDSGARPGFNSNEPATAGDGFAADRSGRANGSAGFPQTNGAQASRGAVSPQILQSGMNTTTYDESAEFLRTPGENPQFPQPFTLGALPPTPPVPPRTGPKPIVPGGRNPTPPGQSSQNARPIGPNAVVVPPTETIKELPGMDQALYPTSPSKEGEANPDGSSPPPVSPKKAPKKLDNAALEKVLRNRNGGGTDTPGGP